MAINLSDNIHVSGPKPTESKYLNITVPYTGITEVNSCIPEGERHVGLTVNINNVDYWYRAGIADGDLIEKTYTGDTTTYLKLNQSTPQTISCGQPIFNDGIIFNTSPSASLISGHTTGKMYYDAQYETISVNINDAVNLQLGQEDLRYAYNSTGSIIPNGSVVKIVSVYDGGGVTADVVTIELAQADNIANSRVLGLTTQDIGINSYGFVTSRGHLNELNTSGSSSQYSGMTVGDNIYLSESVAGGVTNIEPVAPNIKVLLGKLITKHPINGKIFIGIINLNSLNDLADVDTNSPNLDDVLKWNGVNWVNGTVAMTSAGVNYYYATPIINDRTQPVGLNSAGTLGNGVFVATLSKIPVIAGGTQQICATANADTRAVTAWYNELPIGRYSIDSGTWDFTSWYCVDSAVGDTTIINNIYQVVPITGGTIQVTGSSANTRTATISGYEFCGEYFSASTINTDSSWLQISSGIYQICEKIDSSNVCIVVPTGYVNSGGTGNTWNKLFGATSATLESTSFTCYTTSLTEPAFIVSPTDKLGRMGFLSTTGARTVTMTYNGVTQASYMKTPLITLHNDLAGLQGGTESERYHITLSEHGVLQNTTGVNTGDETKISIEGKLTGEITTHTHPYSGLTGIPNFSGLTNNFNSHTGDTTIHFTEDSININISQVSGLTDSLLLKSDTGHTHSYTGTTILNKPSFTGSGNTTVSLVGNEYRIYSTGDSVFTENILVSISAGKTFGKYENGDTIPASGKTAAQVIQMALAEALPPTVNLSSSGNNVAFGESGKTVNLSFSYTINTVGAHVETVLLEWRRGGTGSWSGLTTNTGDTTYNHTIYELNRFNTSQINYQYTVTDNQGGTYIATHNVTPTAYAIPTISPTYVGTVVSPETQSIRELGNVDTTIAGTVDSNNSLVNVTGYTTYRRINGGAYSAIITCTGLCSVSPITIASYLDSGATGTATSVGYCVSVGDEYTTSSGGACTITFRSMSYYGCNPNTTLIGSEVCGLGNAASLTTNDRTMTNVTSGVGNYTYIAFPATYGDLTSIKLGGVEEVITAWSCLSPDVSVTNGHGQSVDYIVYRSLATNAYTSATLVIT